MALQMHMDTVILGNKFLHVLSNGAALFDVFGC